MEKTIYETPVYKFGKTQWKMIVFRRDNALIHLANGEFGTGAVNFTRYQYYDYNQWRNDTDHKNYDGNDTYAGLPKSLTKIYYKHEAEIKSALAKGE